MRRRQHLIITVLVVYQGAGAMLYYDEGITYEMKMGDGSDPQMLI